MQPQMTTDIASVSTNAEKEFALTAKDFKRLMSLVQAEAGIVMSAGKQSFIHSRLSKRLRELDIDSFSSYISLIESPEGAEERSNTISALTTNVTSFFRERHHFDTVTKDVFLSHNSSETIRIWSAGCSSGAEPYSIAMSSSAASAKLGKKVPVKIIATDIDRKIIAKAKAGRYTEREIEGLSKDELLKYFEREGQQEQRTWTVKPELRACVKYNYLNLMEEWPFRQKLDVIFCRNVVIYFDEPTKQRLYSRFAELLKPGGWLFLGHSERLSGPANAKFTNVGVTSYKLI